jgi:localization factor PodJL
MRSELPWNVAGIPPEAREAARAAARREGLSVGEWLTRRILRSFSGMEEDIPAMPYESRAAAGIPLDSWGLPQSSASRRDSEEMMARVGRSESESNEAWRRIEDQLRGLGRRLDSSERSHGESNRVISRTAQELNITAREQAQAFEQLGENVMSLNSRLERLERGAAHDGIRDAVKALHQGLSRLADQITATANNSANQVVQLTTNLEQLAGHVGQVRAETEDAIGALDHRIDNSARAAEARIAHVENSALANASALAERIESSERALAARLSAAENTTQSNANALADRVESGEQAIATRLDSIEKATQSRTDALAERIDSSERGIEARLSAAEKTGQFNTNALDHALEKIETGANQRATDQVETQRRAAQHEESLGRLEDSIARLEMRLPDAEFERRLDGIEQSVSGMADRLEHHNPAEQFGASMQALTHRLEALEKDHDDLLQELRTKLRPVEPPAYEAPQAHSAFEAPPVVEPPQEHEQPAYEPHAYDEPPHTAFAHSAEPVDAFAPPPTPHGFSFDIPQEPAADAFTPDFDEVFVEGPAEAEPENFLAQARRSARAASEKAEAERSGRLSAFRWSQNAAAEGEEKAKPRYLIPVLVALIVVLAAAAALVLSQRAKAPAPAPEQATVTRPPRPTGPAYSLPSSPDSDDTQFVVAPQAGGQSGGNAEDFSSQRSEPAASDAPPHAAAPPRTATPPQQRDVRTAPVKSVPEATPPKTAGLSPDRVVQMANAGNPVALTILGLRALDGTGPAINLPDAVKFLSQAADKGQAVAQYRLGTLYERGQGVTADPAKAAHWYEMAANQGNRKAMHNLAVSYAARKNMAESARWFAKAAALGLSDSQFNLAVLYERGDGVPQSLLDAFKWYSIAATTGDSESKARIVALQSQLSDSDKAAATKSAATFHAAPLNRAANVPPEPADLGN